MPDDVLDDWWDLLEIRREALHERINAAMESAAARKDAVPEQVILEVLVAVADYALL